MRALVVALLVIARVAHATPTTEHPLEDSAAVVPDGDEPALEAELRDLRATGVDLGVMVIDSTGSQSIEAYTRAHAADWGTGNTPSALFVLAIQDRHSRLEVSDPLRSKFPDARAQSILDNIRGYLRSADYTGAIRAVIAEVKAGATGVAPDLESPHPQVEAGSDTAVFPATPAPAYEPPRTERKRPVDHTIPLIAGMVGGALLLGGVLWARSRIASRATLTGNGAVSSRPLWLETLWCMALIIGGIVYIAVIMLGSTSSSGSSYSSSSSTWTGSSSSSSSSTSSSSGGGGWSGGGASSSW